VTPAETGTFDRQLTGVYVADRRGQPVIDVHGWVAPAAASTGGQTVTTPTPAAAPAQARAVPPPRSPRSMPGPTPPPTRGTTP
jgi:hypothetical protein